MNILNQTEALQIKLTELEWANEQLANLKGRADNVPTSDAAAQQRQRLESDKHNTKLDLLSVFWFATFTELQPVAEELSVKLASEQETKLQAEYDAFNNARSVQKKLKQEIEEAEQITEQVSEVQQQLAQCRQQLADTKEQLQDEQNDEARTKRKRFFRTLAYTPALALFCITVIISLEYLAA